MSTIQVGPIHVRYSWKGVARWGYPVLQIGGLSLWDRTSGGDRMIAAYHPRWSLTWIWSAQITGKTRGYDPIWSSAERHRLARLHREGNPYVGPPRWWHRFYQPTFCRRGQWHDYIRLPFGRSLVIGRQDAMRRWRG